MTGAGVVDGNVYSATGTISLPSGSPVINGNAQAAGTITVGGGAQIKGTRLANSPSTSPASRALPAFTWNAADSSWPQPVTTYASCTAFDTYVRAHMSAIVGTFRITSDCLWSLAGSDTVTVTGNTAIVSDGTFDFSHGAQIRSTTGTKQLSMISLHAGTGVNDATGVAFVGNFQTPGLNVFTFAKNRATKSNGVVMTGQIYADRIDPSGAFTLNFKAMSVPGFTVAGGGNQVTTSYTAQVLYVREVAT
jgi:hypothetical protein